MEINLTYQGVLAAQNTRKNFDNPPPDPLAGKELEVIRGGQAFKLTVSADMIKFKDDTADFFARDVNVQNADPSDLFSYRPADQWLVFSQYLHETNFFDSLSKEEMINAESTLQDITEGLDSLTRTGINLFGGLNTQLNSYEAHIELASSSAALNLFSEKFLTGDIKEGFDQLTRQYVEHNTKKVNGYQSIEERFYTARSKITPVGAALTSDQAQQLSITNKLGKTVYSEEELSKLIQSYTELFSSIEDESDMSSVLLEAKRQLIEFVTKGIPPRDSDYNKASDFVNQKAQNTFERIGEYWKNLLKS